MDTTKTQTKETQMASFTKFTVFYLVPGEYKSSTLVYAASKDEAEKVVAGKFAQGRAVVAGVA